MENKERKRTAAVILAAGSGTRMQCDKTKQNIEILGESILFRSVKAFEICSAVDYITVVVREDELEDAEKSLGQFKKIKAIVAGGSTRRESAKLGFNAIPEDSELVAVHDAARCLITPEMIEEVAVCADKYGAASAVRPIVDTLKLSEGNFMTKTLPREQIFAAETPQIFLVDLYKKALEITENDVDITDDNMMLERLGKQVYCVNVGRENLKITTPFDLDFAEFIIEKRMKNE